MQPPRTDRGCATSDRLIARQRMAGHVGLIATLIVLTALMA
jgi:hypothetical protein